MTDLSILKSNHFLKNFDGTLYVTRQYLYNNNIKENIKIMRKFTSGDISLADISSESSNSVLMIFTFDNPDMTDIDSYYDEDGNTDWSVVLEVVYNFKTHRITDSQIVYVDPDNVSDDEVSYSLSFSEISAVESAFDDAYGRALASMTGFESNKPIF